MNSYKEQFVRISIGLYESKGGGGLSEKQAYRKRTPDRQPCTKLKSSQWKQFLLLKFIERRLAKIGFP